ncbi:MAG: universal stress protein [Gallionella sp.]|jgi:nucleotide-binding universal stress UspA family protein
MKLLVGVDLSELTEKVVQKAEEVAKALSAKVWIIHVAEPKPDFVGLEIGPQYIRDSRSKRFHHEHRQIHEIADRLRKAGLDTTALLVQGATVESILKEASRLDVDMIVLGSHGRGRMYQLVVGSVSKGVLHKSEWPVLIVPTHERRTLPEPANV